MLDAEQISLCYKMMYYILCSVKYFYTFVMCRYNLVYDEKCTENYYILSCIKHVDIFF